MPWPIGLLAEYVREPDEATTATVTYGLVMTAMAIAFAAVWAWLAHRPALLRPAQRPRVGAAVRRSLVGPAVDGLSTAVALVNAPAAFVLFAAVAVFFAVSGRRAAAGAGAAPENQPDSADQVRSRPTEPPR